MAKLILSVPLKSEGDDTSNAPVAPANKENLVTVHVLFSTIPHVEFPSKEF